MASIPAFDTDGTPNFDAAAALGYRVVGLYTKNCTPEFAVEAKARDMGIFLFGEVWASDPDGGAPLGVARAQLYIDQARAAGAPKGAGIYVANDQEITDWTDTLNYFEAAGQTLIAAGFVPGLYGQTVLYSKIQPFGYKLFAHAPDGTTPPAFANVVCDVPPNVTLAGMFVDIDSVQTPDNFGGWNAGGLWPTPTPAVTPKEPGMFFVSNGAVYFAPGLTFEVPSGPNAGVYFANGSGGVKLNPNSTKAVKAHSELIVADPVQGLYNELVEAKSFKASAVQVKANGVTALQAQAKAGHIVILSDVAGSLRNQLVLGNEAS